MPVVMLQGCRKATRARLKITEIVIHASGKYVKKIFFKLNFADNKINVNYSKYRTVGRKNIQLSSLLKNTKVYFDLWF